MYVLKLSRLYIVNAPVPTTTVLLAAYTVEEVRDQVSQAGLRGIDVEMASDRHWIASGRLMA